MERLSCTHATPWNSQLQARGLMIAGMHITLHHTKHVFSCTLVPQTHPWRRQ
jgi:hypothetical protein